ncbi:MAG: molybdopterin-synthase adenylyltransferase MoeB [Silicimonas sp.]
MSLVFVLAAALWAIGHLLRVPLSGRLIMIAILYVAVLMVQVALPAGHALRTATGGSAGEWLVLGGLVGVVWLYSRGLKTLKSKARPENKREGATTSSATEIERNARHIVLREIGGPGQKRLKEARVLVVGAGGLGAPALQYLAAAGVGTIGVIDHDEVENSNLQRQVIHTDDRIGMPKVFSAEMALKAQNPFVIVRPYNRRLSEEVAADLFADYDVILDGTDDSATRYLVNETAVALTLPLVSAAISQWEGQISIFAPSRGAPCYRCVFPEPAAPGLAPTCAEGGVLGPLPGVVGAMMAVETIKLLTGAGEPLLGRMMIYDALYADVRVIGVKRRDDCPVCGNR